MHSRCVGGGGVGLVFVSVTMPLGALRPMLLRGWLDAPAHVFLVQGSLAINRVLYHLVVVCKTCWACPRVPVPVCTTCGMKPNALRIITAFDAIKQGCVVKCAFSLLESC